MGAAVGGWGVEPVCSPELLESLSPHAPPSDNSMTAKTDDEPGAKRRLCM